MSTPTDEGRDASLRPQLGFFDAVARGLAAILGVGIFAVIAPAAAGLVGCFALAFSLPLQDVEIGLAIFSLAFSSGLRLVVTNRS